MKSAFVSILKNYSSALQVAPLGLVILLFLIGPIIVITIFSFYKYTGFFMVQDFVAENYVEVFASANTWVTYLATLKMVAITLALTFVFGFILAYYLVFDIVQFRWKIFLFLLTIVPFWTSGVIRMIAWIPFLGKEGLINQAIIGIGLSDRPLEFLLFSEFAVILSYVHMFTLFMAAPLFNVMAKIDRSLIEAARDAGASGIQLLFNIVIPLCKPGIAIGTIFVLTLVAGDFTVVRVLSGSQVGPVSVAMANQVKVMQYPFACASAIVLLVVLLLVVGGIMRVIDVRKQL